MIDDAYLWVVIVGGFAAFFASMGIGANDVANAFATAVGSKALTMKKAVVIASIFECLGAILMGSHVTNTIREGIADYKCFEETPELLMYGCMCVLFAVGIWLFLASYFEMAVSTTHSCVGGMVGMTMTIKGSNCVIWYAERSTFPYVGGVYGIILSWFISPIMSAIISGLLFFTTRYFVLRHKDSFKRTFMSMPIFIGLTLILNTFFIIYKGAKGLGLDKTQLPIAVGTAFGIGGFFGLLVIPFIPKMRANINKIFEKKKELEEKEKEKEMKNLNGTIINVENINDNNKNDDNNSNNIQEEKEEKEEKKEEKKENKIKMKQRIKNAYNSINIDIESDIIADKKVSEIHNKAEKFDEKTEEGFKFLQIFTAICDSFSHGANDVANAIGPFAAIYLIWINGDIKKKMEMNDDAYWILALGGVGIVVGLLLYGYKIIRAIGIKICKITPSRGFAIELGTATIIILGSRLGIPLSTTHCQIGGTMGVASLENFKKCSGLNWTVVMKAIIGWFLTLLIVGGTTSLFVSMGIYAPTVIGNECNNQILNNTHT